MNTIFYLMELMDTKPTNIGFALIKITTEQFAIIEEGFVDKGEFQIHTNIRFAADNTHRLVGVFTSFTLASEAKPFIVVEAGCHFKIKEEDWGTMLNESKSQLTIPKGFLQHLAVLTVGTTRGILHAKTENTCFNKYHLPTINVADLIKEDNTFTFNKVIE